MTTMCFSLRRCLALAGILLVPSAQFLRADQIEMKNGDRYVGTVLSMTADSVVLQSQMLGKVVVPRSKVSLISLGMAPLPVAPTAAAVAPVSSASAKESGVDVATALRQLGANTNAIEQIRLQFLQGAGQQANDKFNQLLDGLSSGKMDINGLRAEAKSAADQLRALKKGMGSDDTLDAYLNILDSFLAESAPSPTVSTNTSPGITTIQ
jgi:hypothetical protein